MRYLSAHNKQLTDEMSNLKTRWVAESEKTKDVYETEMRQLRQLLDDAEREKADSLAKLLSSQQSNRNQEEQCVHTFVIFIKYIYLIKKSRQYAIRGGQW